MMMKELKTGGARLLGLLAAALLLAACGASGGGDKGTSFMMLLGGAAPSGDTISGVAAVGKPLRGTVYLKDALGVTVSADTAADGSFSLSVKDLVPPFILMVEGAPNGNGPTVRLYSAIDAAGRANITPVTNALVALAAADVPQDAFGAAAMKTTGTVVSLPGDFHERLAQAKSAFDAILTQVKGDGFDLVSGAFTADGTGFDRLLDTLSVTVDGASGTVRLGLRDQALAGAAIDLDADLSDPASYQGAADAVQARRSFINNPAFRPKYCVQHRSPGPDGIWYTDDDKVWSGTTQNTMLFEYDYYPSGRKNHLYIHSGPGPDGLWLPTAAAPHAMNDNPKTAFMTFTDEDEPTLTGGMAGDYVVTISRGVTDSQRWERTVYRDKTTAAIASHQTAYYDAATGQQLSMVWASNANYATNPNGIAGPDGLLYTNDDMIMLYMKLDGASGNMVAYSNAGPDGNWFATADNTIAMYIPPTMITSQAEGAEQLMFKYAGPDGVWFTADDAIGMWAQMVYEPVL